jgi:hypothetical protein
MGNPNLRAVFFNIPFFDESGDATNLKPWYLKYELGFELGFGLGLYSSRSFS